MQRGVVDVGIFEGIGTWFVFVILHIGHRLCIAIHISKFWTFRKGLTIYAFYAIADGNSGQAAATRESRAFYARHAVGNRDGGQTTATIESTPSYARHAVGNRDGGQAAAIIESIFSDACYGEIYNSLEITLLP